MSSMPVSRMPVAQTTTDLADLRRLGRLYHLHDTAVAEYLAQHPQLVEFLLEAHPHIEQAFGEQPKLVLEMVIDPEYSSPPELFAYIWTDLPVDQALASLHSFDDWYLDQPDDLSGLITFTLRFA